MGKLNSRRVKTAGPGRYVDGGGLMLVVREGGSRSWIVRYQLAGRRRDMGLGRYPEVSLAEARERASRVREVLRARRDPLADEGRMRETRTFREAAEELIAHKRPGWRNEKHAAQWSSTLGQYVYTVIGDLDVAAVDTDHVLRILSPIWSTKTETASRVRQRVEAVVDYAVARKYRPAGHINPATWRGHLAHVLPKPTAVREVEHHSALHWRELPALVERLRASPSTGARALSFAILTAARSGEVRGATWAEIDLRDAVWTIPARRMKGRREQRVPLVPEALDLLGVPGEPDALVFGSMIKAGRALSDMTLTAALRRLGHRDITVHGFRSTFRDWAGETTAHPREVIEHALAHKLQDKVEAAYARGDMFEKRRRLMHDWAAFLMDRPTVVPIRSAAG